MTAAPARKGRNGLPPITHCKHGHAFDEKNTYTTADGKRYCRACASARNARIYAAEHAGDIGNESPVINLLAAIVRQSITDREQGHGDDYDSAIDFLAHCGLLCWDASVRRPGAR